MTTELMGANQSPIHPAHAPFSVPGMQPFPDKLYVITCINNPGRYLTRWRHYREFEKHIADAGAVLYTVEAAFGGREFEITQRGKPGNIQIRGGDLTEIWLKENLMNIGLHHLPPEAKYVAFIDADITFARPDWAQETLHMLQHYSVVQMYTDIVYLSHEGRTLNQINSFMDAWLNHKELRTVNGMATRETFKTPGQQKEHKHQQYPYAGMKGGFGQPGAAWAWRREALDVVGGLIDISILGSGDYQMAAALIGHLGISVAKSYSDGYQKVLYAWQDRTERHIRRNVGCVNGTILHSWHGPMKSRGYDWRWKILSQFAYDPASDLTRDSQGLLRLHDDGSERFINLRDSLRSYFRQRSEDAVPG